MGRAEDNLTRAIYSISGDVSRYKPLHAEAQPARQLRRHRLRRADAARAGSCWLFDEETKSFDFVAVALDAYRPTERHTLAVYTFVTRA